MLFRSLLSAALFATACAAATAVVSKPSASVRDALSFEVTLESQPEVLWNGATDFAIKSPSRKALKLKQSAAGDAAWVQGRILVGATPGSPPSYTLNTVQLLPQPASDVPPTATPIPLHPTGEKPQVTPLGNTTSSPKLKGQYLVYGKGDIVDFGCELSVNEYCVSKDSSGKVLFKIRRVQ